MITLAVATILLTITAPDLAALMQSSRMSSELNHLVGLLHYARSEAVKRNQPVRLCKSLDGISCNTNTSVRWDQGWLIFADSNQDGSPDDEAIIMVQPALEKITVNYAAFGSSNYVIYHPNGRTNNGTFSFCDGRGTESARAIIIFKSGRIRTSHTSADGTGIECP